jgi:hypothetical protein
MNAATGRETFSTIRSLHDPATLPRGRPDWKISASKKRAPHMERPLLEYTPLTWTAGSSPYQSDRSQSSAAAFTRSEEGPGRLKGVVFTCSLTMLLVLSTFSVRKRKAN